MVVRALLAALLCLSAVAAYAQTASQTFSERAQSAFGFTDAIGVNSLPFRHLNGSKVNDPRFCFNILVPAMKDLGITHFRSDIPWYVPANPQTDKTFIAFNYAIQNGLKPLLVLRLRHTRDSEGGSHTNDPTDVVSVVKYFGVRNIDGVEGVNEYYVSNTDHACPQILLTYSKQIHDALRADPLTKDVRIVGPSLNGSVKVRDYNDFYSDVNTFHFYDKPYYSAPDVYQANNAIEQIQASNPAKPNMITETGFSNCICQPKGDSQHCEPEAVAAKDIGRQLLRYYCSPQRYQRIFIYQFMDAAVNPNDREANYGLLTATPDNIKATRKPIYFALRNLVHTLADNNRPFTPGNLTFSLTGNLTNIKHALLQKTNGSFYLALWQEVNSARNPPPASVPIQLKLTAQAKRLVVYDTLKSEQPASSSANASKINLLVPDNVLVVEVVPASR